MEKNDVECKVWNPEGVFQVQLEEFTEENRYEQNKIQKMLSSSYLLFGFGVYFLFKKFSKFQLPQVQEVAKVLLGVKLWQFCEIAELELRKIFSSLQVLRWILSGTGGNVISNLLACREKLSYIGIRLQDSQAQSTDVKRWLRELLGT